MNNQDAKGLIKMPVAKYSRTGLPSGCRIIIILSKLTNRKEKKKPRKTQRLKQNKTHLQNHFIQLYFKKSLKRN